MSEPSSTDQPNTQPRVGDVVNGHRLEQQPNGAFQWVPVDPNAPAPKRKRRIGLWITLAAVALLVFIIAIGSANAKPSNEAPAEDKPAASVEQPSDEAEAPAEEPAAEPAPEPEPEAPAEPELTLAQKNALGKAEQYIANMPFSRTGLIGQMEYEGFTTEESTWAVDTLGADWNAQAGLKAKQYLDNMSFSREALYEQLVYEGFSDAEANAGLAAVGY